MKIVRESLFEMKGGKGEHLNPNDVDQDQLAIGKEVEMEHTDDKEISKQISLDHLKEHPKYYTKLVKAGLVDEPKAINIYNKIK